MSGIVGTVAQEPVNQTLYDALLLLQHRGQDAAGIVTQDGRRFHMHKAKGMVRDVFRTRNMRSLLGHIGLGQVRYPTTDSAGNMEEAQPFYVNAPFGIVLVNNGSLTNAAELRQELFENDHRHLNTESDTEVLINIFAHELELASRGPGLNSDSLFTAIEAVQRRIRGAYAVVALVADFGLVAFRDPHGIRPLCMGRSDDGAVMVASESVALEGTLYHFERDVAPGEAVLVNAQGEVFSRQCCAAAEPAPCIFEYIYLARPDSTIDGISVYQARVNMGESLAEEVLKQLRIEDIDAVIPIPESSRPSAMQLAQHLGLPYREGFVKNRYVGRTFIMPGQAVRKKSVRQKLNTITSEFKGRNVLLVDDSIVRGTTSQEIVQMARQAGANKVYLASAAPPVRHPNIYGIDMPSANDLIAHERSIEDIRQWIGVDALIYQDLAAMEAAVSRLNPNIQRFEASCFDADYITGDDGQMNAHKAPQQSRLPLGDEADDSGWDSSISLPNSEQEA